MSIFICLSVCECRLDLGRDLQSRSNRTQKDRNQTWSSRQSYQILLSLCFMHECGVYVRIIVKSRRLQTVISAFITEPLELVHKGFSHPHHIHSHMLKTQDSVLKFLSQFTSLGDFKKQSNELMHSHMLSIQDIFSIFLNVNNIREFKGLVRTHMSTCQFFRDFKIPQGCTNDTQ